MPRQQPDERDLAELTVEELEAEEAIVLPDREALSLINPHLATLAGTTIIIPDRPGDPTHGTDPHESAPAHQEPQHE